MQLAVVAHCRTGTNDALAAPRAPSGCRHPCSPRATRSRTLRPGDVALGRLDVRGSLDGVEAGSAELERLADAGVEVLNPASTLAVAHDKLLIARVLRRAGVPHPRSRHLEVGAPTAAPACRPRPHSSSSR